MPQNRTRSITLAVSLAVALSADFVISQSDVTKPGRTPVTARLPKAAAKPSSSTPQQQNKGEATELKGIVRDPSGKTAANVTVWFVVGRDDVFDAPLETRTDDSGRFSFAIVDEAVLFVPGNTIAVAARDAEGRLGWRNLALSTRAQSLHEIRLREGSSLSGCVLDAEGHGLGGARLAPKAFTEPRSEGVASTVSETLALWPALAEEYSVPTAPDGGFEIANVPRAVQARCVLTAGDEKAEVVIEAGIAATIRLGSAGSIAGTLTLPEGAQLPVKGFQLQASLQRGSNRPQEPSLEFNSLAVVDEQGRFSFAGLPPGRYVIRPAAQQNMPFFAAVSAPLDVKSGQLLEDIALPVTPCREVRGRVVDRDTGQGIQGVEVGVYTSEPPGGIRHGQTVVTDAEGRFSTWLVPGKVQTFLRQTPAEYLPPPLQNVTTLSGPSGATLGLPDFGDNPLIELEPAVAIEGIVVDKSGKAVPLAWLNIQRAPVQRYGSWQSPPDRADPSGKFVVRQLEPAASVVLRAHTSTAATLEPVTIVPSTLDGPVRLVVAEKHACRFRGQVVDRHGKPLPEARVLITGVRQLPMELPTVRSFLRLHSSVEIPQVAADGTFTSDALYAGDTYEVQVVAPGYGARQGKTAVGQAGQVYDVGHLVLDAFVNIRGVVVDARGKAAPHAELRVAMPAASAQPASGLVEVHADEAGAFELPPANVEGVLRIWARSGQHTTDVPASFFPDLIDGPLRIELAEQPGLRIAARVADLQGRPVAASVEVIWQTEQSSQDLPRRVLGFGGFARARRPNQRSSLAGAAVGADGSLLIEALWPDQPYHLVVTAAGYQKLESASVSGRSGETVDLGRLIMRREDLAVEGEVVDAGGQPVADATVYNSGDAHRALTMTTDAAGRFRLTGLLEGPVSVLVRKPGYWSAGLRCTAGDVGQRVRLVSNEQPRLQTRPAQRVNDAPLDRRDLALRLLGELWERRAEYDSRNSSRGGFRAGGGGPRGGDVVRRMAGLDYSQALQWSAAEGGTFDEVVRIRAFDQIAGDDVDRAIAHAGAPGARRRLMWMARTRIAAGARDDAVRLLEAALDANPTSEIAYPEPSAEIMSRAQLGALAIAAGRDECGRRLINEAADRVELLGKDGDAQSRAAVAAALASFDAPRSVRLWVLLPEPASGISAEMHGELAALVGVYDLAAARRIMTRSPKPSVPGRRGRASPPNDSPPNDSPPDDFQPILIKIARRLAGTQPEKALALIDDVGQNSQLDKAEIVGRAALALAPADTARAYELIDQALTLCFTAPQAPQQAFVLIPSNRVQTAARIAIMAAEAGYPDLEAIEDQVLALRPPPLEPSRDALRSAITIEAAWLLAMIDPPLARHLLSRVSAPEAAARSFDDARTMAHWLQAWVMIDVDHAVELFHQVLNEQRHSLTSECVSYGLLPMIDSLFWSPDARRWAALQSTSPSWFPYNLD